MSNKLIFYLFRLLKHISQAPCELYHWSTRWQCCYNENSYQLGKPGLLRATRDPSDASRAVQKLRELPPLLQWLHDTVSLPRVSLSEKLLVGLFAFSLKSKRR